MSGGSFDYLYAKDTLIGHHDKVTEMAKGGTCLVVMHNGSQYIAKMSANTVVLLMNQQAE